MSKWRLRTTRFLTGWLNVLLGWLACLACVKAASSSGLRFAFIDSPIMIADNFTVRAYDSRTFSKLKARRRPPQLPIDRVFASFESPVRCARCLRVG